MHFILHRSTLIKRVIWRLWSWALSFSTDLQWQMELLTILWFQAVNQRYMGLLQPHVLCGSGTCPSFHHLVTTAPRRVLIVSGTFLLSNIFTNVQVLISATRCSDIYWKCNTLEALTNSTGRGRMQSHLMLDSTLPQKHIRTLFILPFDCTQELVSFTRVFQVSPHFYA